MEGEKRVWGYRGRIIVRGGDVVEVIDVLEKPRPRKDCDGKREMGNGRIYVVCCTYIPFFVVYTFLRTQKWAVCREFIIRS
ncbi:hypothetical protein EX30DRAFT_337758 [Ascodesmis nigricans]|uniref:Uncharacterized protein n=1 Tax=Ascodesmis nigricans TaxID=341454 RepID=A0A4S2N7Z5_9PEZI|nr:hypothetical protein EX30DRAFT_337758 [Ascodesmis nigricans]